MPTPTVNLEFADLDAAELQTALLGAQKKGTLLSTVIARLTPIVDAHVACVSGNAES